MSAEYSVGEVRERINKAWQNHDENGRVHISMGDAMALVEQILPERIKADEGAVTDEIVEIAAEKHMRVRGLGMHAPWQTMTEDTRIGYRKAMRAALLAVWPNPPAQAAQVDRRATGEG